MQPRWFLRNWPRSKWPLQAAAAFGDCLELACGTGLWTRHLAACCERLTAVDASPEMLARCAQRLGPTSRATFLGADLFQWEPPRRFDFVFFAFWLSHVPPRRFGEFWSLVRRTLSPGARVFLLDSRRHETSPAHDHVLPPTD